MFRFHRTLQTYHPKGTWVREKQKGGGKVKSVRANNELQGRAEKMNGEVSGEGVAIGQTV